MNDREGAKHNPVKIVVEYLDELVGCELSFYYVYWTADLKVSYYYVTYDGHIILDNSAWSNRIHK